MAEFVLNNEQIAQRVNETEEVVKLCIAGNRTAQKQLYDMFSGKMFAICLRYASNRAGAEDILQEGFIKLFNNLDKFKNIGSFEGWVKRIFINTAIEQYRKAIQSERYIEIDQVYNIQNQEEDANSRLARHDLLKLVQQLPDGYRTVFNLYAIEGYGHKEIAQMLEISIGTSKSQLSRARLFLQKMLSELK